MRKNSNTAHTISQNLHQMMQAIIDGNEGKRARCWGRAWILDKRNRDRGGNGYALKWVVEIAEQYPAALDAAPQVGDWVRQWRLEYRAWLRGRREAETWGRHDNPYCGYTQSLQHEAWLTGWERKPRPDSVIPST